METTKTIFRINNTGIVIVDTNGEKYVPIKPICEALEISFPSQLEKIKDDDFLSSVISLSSTTGKDGKQYEMVCLPYKFIFGWLFTINPKNVKPEAQEAVAKYRIECYNALYQHFADITTYLKQKEKGVNDKLDILEQIRTDFKNTKNKLDVAQKELTEARAYTFELWQLSKQTECSFDPKVEGEE